MDSTRPASRPVGWQLFDLLRKSCEPATILPAKERSMAPIAA